MFISYQQTDISIVYIKQLYTMYQSMQGLRNNEQTSRVGIKWLPEEDAELYQEVLNNLSYDEIAAKHKRTVTGVQSRVISTILYPKYKYANTSIDALVHQYQIDKETVQKYINKLENPTPKKEPKPKENTPSQYSDKITELKLTSLETKLMILEQKLDLIITTLLA